MISFNKLTAREELRMPRLAAELIPHLLRQGLGWEDAVAVAHNAALLFLVLPERPDELSSPREVLGLYSLGEIAGLCEEYRVFADGEAEV